jgi:hypothetical protein
MRTNCVIELSRTFERLETDRSPSQLSNSGIFRRPRLIINTVRPSGADGKSLSD